MPSTGGPNVPGSGWSQSPVGIDASMAAICVRKVNQLGDLGIDLAEAAGEVLLGRLARADPLQGQGRADEFAGSRGSG